MNLNGPEFGYWLTRGTIALVVAVLFLTSLYWIDIRRGRKESSAEQDARLDAERRSRALAKVNELKPLSMHGAVRLDAARKSKS